MSTHVVDIEKNEYYINSAGKLIFVYEKDEDTIYTIGIDGLIQDYSTKGRIMFSWIPLMTSWTKEKMIDDLKYWISIHKDDSFPYVINLKRILSIMTNTETTERSKKLLLII